MKRIFPAILMLLIACKLGYCGTPSIQVKLTASPPEIFVGQEIGAIVEVANTGKADIQLPSPDCSVFHALLDIDNPHLGFAGGVEIVCSDMVKVKPGESINTKVFLSGTVHGLGLITFRIGFKPTADLVPVWSNPVTVRFKSDTDLPVKVEASLKENTLNISNVQNPQILTAHVRITNTSNAPQEIGVDNECGLHELMDLISDNKSILIVSGVASCLKNPFAEREVTLKPKEVYKQDCHVNYIGEESNPKLILFRIGVKNVGYNPVWSNPLTVNIIGGSRQWTKHIIYSENITKQDTAPHSDGVNKKYYENGTLMEEATYKNNKLNGSYKRYYDNGRLWEELNYVDERIDGRDKRYDKDGKLTADSFYSNSQLISSITYNANGTIHGDMVFMKLVNGNYIPWQCAKDDSDDQVLDMFPSCTVRTIPPSVDDPADSQGLFLAVRSNNANAVVHELEKGADVNKQDKNGYTALMFSMMYGFKDTKIVNILLSHGARPNIQSNDGTTALMLAASHMADIKIVKMLLQHGADPKIKDFYGRTALKLASMPLNPDVHNKDLLDAHSEIIQALRDVKP